jgi:uncharacterized membrane protein YhaH (DUF805 family)
MSTELRNQAYRILNQKETDELIRIWQLNDHAEWSEMAFDVIREILQERHAELPPQNEPINKKDNIKGLVADKVADMNLAQLYFSFDGRIGLATYWLKGALPIFAFLVMISLIDVAYFDYSPYSGILTLVGRGLIIWPGLALTVKRWHDRDKSGLWALIGIIPYIGPAWAFIENGFLPGTEGPNQYGSKSF